jgi:hypothetical protein
MCQKADCAMVAAIHKVYPNKLTVFCIFPENICDPKLSIADTSDRGGLRRGSAAARFMGLRFRIPSESWMSVFCDYCALSGRGLSADLTTRPEDSYRVWSV